VGWAQELWVRDAQAGHPPSPGNGRGTFAGQQEKDGTTVLSINCSPGSTAWDRSSPLAFTQAGGRLWIGSKSGWLLGVEPFHEQHGGPVIRGWLAGGAVQWLRLRGDGLWLLVITDHSIGALGLLELDRSSVQPVDPKILAAVPPSDRLVSDPLLIRASEQDALERLALWATSSAHGLSLWCAWLSIYGKEAAPVAQYRLMNDRGEPLHIPAEQRRVALLPTAFAGRDAIILATGTDLWMFPVPVPAHAQSVVLTRLVGETQFCIHARPDLPGIILLPSQKEGARVIVSRQEGFARQELLAIPLPGSAAVSSASDEFPGIPVAQVGEGEVLCLAQTQLKRWQVRRNEWHEAGGHSYLAQARHCQAYGRLVACCGLQSASWFTLVLDWGETRTVYLHQKNTWTAPPVMLGRYLFTLEADEETEGPNLILRRRWLRPDLQESASEPI